MRRHVWSRIAKRIWLGAAKPAIVFTALAVAAPVYAQSFTLVDLGLADFYGRGISVSINNVYPNYSLAYGVAGDAWIRDADGTTTLLGDLGGGISTPSAINDSRSVAGSSNIPTGARRAALWLNGGQQLINLGVLFPDRNPESFAIALNNNPNVQVVGQSIFDEPQTGLRVAHAFLWQSGTLMDILPGDFQATARGINDLGQVVGTRSVTYPGGGEAFLWDNRTVTNLGHLGSYQGTRNSLAIAISNSRTIVGISTTESVVERAFAWHADDRRMIDLGGLPGRNTSGAWAVSNYGLVVGDAAAVSVQAHATIVGSRAYRPMVDLNNLVIAPGWVLNHAYGVNDQNQIVGLGVVDRQLHGFLLLPIQADSPALRKARACGDLTTAKGLLVQGGAAATSLALNSGSPPWARIGGAVAQFLISGTLGLVMIMCGGDPFDENYPTVYTPQFPGVPAVPDAGSGCPAGLAASLNQAFDHGARAVSYMRAMSVTLNRAQSAFMFGDTQSFSAQDQALGSYEASANSELRALQSGLQSIASVLQGSQCDLMLTRADIEQFIADVRARGVEALPKDELTLFDIFQIDPSTTISLYANLDASQVPLSVSGSLNSAAQGIGILADIYATLPGRDYRALR